MSESKWSELPSDILSLIADRLNKNNNNSDFPAIHNLRLRSVCTSWRSSVSLSLSPPPLPIILPNPSLDPDCDGHFTLSLSSTYLLQSPSSAPTNWLLRIEKNNYYINNRFRLLDPFQNEPFPIGFPKSISLLDFRISRVATIYTLEYDSIQSKKVVASTTSSGSVAIVAILRAKLWFFQTRDNQWTEVNDHHICSSHDNGGGILRYVDVVACNDQFYAVDMFGKLVSFGGGSGLNAVEIVPLLNNNCGFMHLVESDGGLYLVVTGAEMNTPLLYDEFLGVGAFVNLNKLYDETGPLIIYKLNEEEGKWETVNDLDNHAFFIGFEFSYSVSNRDFPALKTNCVYFLGGTFMDVNASEGKIGEFLSKIGVYCLDDGSCGPLANFPDHWPLFLASPTCLMPKALTSMKKRRLAHQGAR